MDRQDSLIHEDETVESLYGGRLKILQKKKGYRYAIDSVLLAHFVEAKRGERLLELGAGSAVISLLLADRHRGLQVTAVEIQADLADMATRRVSLNRLDDRIAILRADLRDAAGSLPAQAWDVAVFNPPYRKVGSGRVNPQAQKALARHEIAGTVADFLEAASRALKPGGRACLIYPCSRMVEAVHRMRALKLEPKRLRMAHSRPGSRGKFVLVEGVKGGGEELAVSKPLYIYREEGGYSDELETLLSGISAPAG